MNKNIRNTYFFYEKNGGSAAIVLTYYYLNCPCKQEPDSFKQEIKDNP